MQIFTPDFNWWPDVFIFLSRYDLPKFIDANSAGLMKSAFKISQKCLDSCKSDAENSIHYGLYEAGLQLLRESKAATIILLNDNSGKYSESVDDKLKSKIILLQKLLLDCKSVLKVYIHDAVCLYSV